VNDLFLTQKRAVRVISLADRRSHTLPLFKRYRILPLQSLNKLQTGMFMYQWCNGLLPTYQNCFITNDKVHTHETRQRQNIHIMPSRTRLRANTIRIHGPKIWNNVSDYIKKATSLHMFKKLYIENLFANLE
jgi:hypothetical protein